MVMSLRSHGTAYLWRTNLGLDVMWQNHVVWTVAVKERESVSLCLCYKICYLQKIVVLFLRRSPVSVAAAAIYMASQASEDKKTQKGNLFYNIPIQYPCTAVFMTFMVYHDWV